MDAAILLLLLRLPTIQAEVRFRRRGQVIGLPSVPRNLDPKPTSLPWRVDQKTMMKELSEPRKNKASEGPIRIPLVSLSFLFRFPLGVDFVGRKTAVVKKSLIEQFRRAIRKSRPGKRWNAIDKSAQFQRIVVWALTGVHRTLRLPGNPGHTDERS